MCLCLCVCVYESRHKSWNILFHQMARRKNGYQSTQGLWTVGIAKTLRFRARESHVFGMRALHAHVNGYGWTYCTYVYVCMVKKLARFCSWPSLVFVQCSSHSTVCSIVIAVAFFPQHFVVVCVCVLFLRWVCYSFSEIICEMLYPDRHTLILSTDKILLVCMNRPTHQRYNSRMLLFFLSLCCFVDSFSSCLGVGECASACVRLSLFVLWFLLLLSVLICHFLCASLSIFTFPNHIWLNWFWIFSTK